MTRKRRGSARGTATGRAALAGSGSAKGGRPDRPAGKPVRRAAPSEAGGSDPRQRASAALMLGAVGLVAAVGVAFVVLGLGPFARSDSRGTTGAGGGHNCPTSQPAPLPAGEERTVRLQTELGTIEIGIEGALSPIAAGNFVALTECGFYDGVGFHRVVPNFVIQAGDPTGRGDGGPGYTIQDEPVTTTYQRGTVAMARRPVPNSVGSQFFIVLSDEARGSLETANTYQIIGSVSAGMDVVDAIAAAADAQNPSDPVVITDATVAEPAAEEPS